MQDTRHEEIRNLDKSQDIVKLIFILLLRKICTNVGEVMCLIKIVPRVVSPSDE
jgi:hypothetical protein